MVEGLPPVGRPLLETALRDLAQLVETYCGGTVRTTILDREHPTAPLA